MELFQRILHLNLSSLLAPQREMLKGSAADAGLDTKESLQRIILYNLIYHRYESHTAKC
jgi:hypothetical protein